MSSALKAEGKFLWFFFFWKNTFPPSLPVPFFYKTILCSNFGDADDRKGIYHIQSSRIFVFLAYSKLFKGMFKWATVEKMMGESGAFSLTLVYSVPLS